MTRDTRPNIVMVVCDQLRSTAIGFDGKEQVHTPHLHAFARQGTRFTNAISNTPLCTPARATLLTGKHVLSHGLVNNEMQLGSDHRSLAHCLGERGYDCAYIGKWHVDGVNRGGFIPPGPRRQGFDDFWAGTECNHDYFDGYYYDDQTQRPVWFDGYEPDGQTQLAIEYVQRKARQKSPFCLVLSLAPPHCPYDQVPERFKELYPAESIEFLPNAADAQVQDRAKSSRRSVPADLSPEERDTRKRRIIADYYAHVTALDHCFGRLIRCIDEQSISEETIVVFTSDHGDMLFSQNRGWKGKPWRESVGIPLLMRWPGRIPAARVSGAPVGLVDLMPTLLALAGAVVPDDVDGLDLSEFIRGNESAAPGSQFINFPCMPAWFRDPAWRGVVTKQYTYVATREGPWLLYDDLEDPFQLRNLVGDSTRQVAAADSQATLDEWLTKTNDPFDTARDVADRYCPGHEGNVLPIPPLPDVIIRGQQERFASRIEASRL